MSDKRKAYDALLDDEDFNRRLLAEKLSPYIKVGKESGDLIFLDGFDSLNNKEKVMVFLLGKKVQNDLKEEETLVVPRNISDSLQINSNSVRTVLKRLREKDLVKKRQGEHYEIPNYRVEEVAQKLD